MMSDAQNEKYAFPSQPWEGKDKGMTLRDYFAAKAMTTIIQEYPTDPHQEGCFVLDNEGSEAIAFYSYQVADAMLKAREQ